MGAPGQDPVSPVLRSPAMDQRRLSMAIQASTTETAAADCGASSHSRQAQLCQGLPEPEAGPPQVSGPALLTERVLAALWAALQETVCKPLSAR